MIDSHGRQAHDEWDERPKRVNDNGEADREGHIHLTGFSLRFESPNRVITRVDGFDDRPFPDVSFRMTITDRLSASNGAVSCVSQPDLDVDTSWLDFLIGAGLFIAPSLQNLASIVFTVERIIIAIVLDTPETEGGAGCSAATLIPNEILIRAGQKVVFSYSRVGVSGEGIFAGGSFVVIRRDPRSQSWGPRS